LFAVIGTTYGSGDGTTTFNIPNLKGRVVVGFNSAETEFDALGETGGAKTHTLTTAQIPTHTHQVTASANTGGTGTGWADLTAGSESVTTDGGTGGGQAHNNLQPYMALNYIISI